MMVLIVFSDVDSTGQACGEPPGPRGADAPEQETGSTRARKGEWRRMRVWGTSAGAQAAPTLTEFGAFRMPSGWHVPPPSHTTVGSPGVVSSQGAHFTGAPDSTAAQGSGWGQLCLPFSWADPNGETHASP